MGADAEQPGQVAREAAWLLRGVLDEVADPTSELRASPVESRRLEGAVLALEEVAAMQP